MKSPPLIIVFCVCRDVNNPLHPGLTCALIYFQVDDVLTIAFTCYSSLFPSVFLFNRHTGFWQQISLDDINKLEFRCFSCVTPGLLPGVLLILVGFYHAHAVSQTTLICRTARVQMGWTLLDLLVVESQVLTELKMEGVFKALSKSFELPVKR